VEQRCNLWSVWLTWLGVPLLVLVVGLQRGWLIGAIVALAGVAAQVAYVRWFPQVSPLMGYGSMADVPAKLATADPAVDLVRLYTASVCPFCPIVRRRLAGLQGRFGFTVQEIDVTFRPDLVREKGIRSVPVIEAAGRLWTGNATSAQLADFLTEAARGNAPAR
jgi:glutaredoxin